MVEWKKLGEVCVIKNGYTPSTKENSYWENGTLPWFTLEDIRKNGRILEDAIKHITSLGVKKGGLFPKDSIIVSTTATIGEYALIKSDFLCNQQITCLTIKTDLKEQLLPKYLYYLSDRIGKWCKKNVNGGGSLLIVSTSKLNNFLIPIPSIEEQNRIVGILDTFTASIDNLKEQIAQRRKQYEYYRDQLLDLEGKEGVEMKSLGEIGEFIRGNGIQKSDFVEEGFSCIHYGQIHAKYGFSAEETISKIDEVLYKRCKKAKKGDVVLATTSEDAEGVAKPFVWLGEEDAAVSGDAFIYHHNQNGKFMGYLFLTHKFMQFKVKYATGAKVVRISGDNMAKYEVALPSLEKQNEIVSILDTFEASIQNLEAQLSQREKQYEYYRNKLLTFE